MIVYGCAVTDAEVYERCAEPGLKRAVDDDVDAELIALAGVGTLARNYNLICERAAAREDLEALVMVHQDAELADEGFGAKVRAALADPEVAIVGCAGAVGVRSIAWWEGAITWASCTQRYEDFGGGEIPAVSWRRDRIPSYASTGEVDSIDGFVIVMSPWAVRNLRFDETLGRHHGYDLDICLQARAAGKKVVTADLRAVHHHSLTLLDDVEGWIEAHMRVAEKWDGKVDGFSTGEGDWKQRARRAEAEAAAARLVAGSAELQRDALRGQLLQVLGAESWRLTAPLRALGRALRRDPARSRAAPAEPSPASSPPRDRGAS